VITGSQQNKIMLAKVGLEPDQAMNVRSQTVRAGVHHGTIPSTFAGEMWIKQRTN